MREMGALTGVRPWNLFLVAIAIGYNPSDPAPKTAIVVAPFERYPEKWAALDWRFSESGKPVPLDRPDSEGVRWRLRTLKDLLSEYVQHPIAEMLAPDGSPCRGYTRGVLRRRPIRDGERWLILKEATVWGDDPRHAFSVPAPEKVRAGQRAASTDWNSKIKPALVVVGPTAVARKMGLAERSTRAWAAGGRHPENPGQVARAIVAVAREAGLVFPADELLRAEEICAEVPRRAASIQLFASAMVALLANRFGSLRAFARALAGDGCADLEPAVRRWLALGQGTPRSIGEINRIIGQLAKFSRAELRKMRRRIHTEPGPTGDLKAFSGYLSLVYGAGKPAVLGPEDVLALSMALSLGSLLAQILSAITSGNGRMSKPPHWPMSIFSTKIHRN